MIIKDDGIELSATLDMPEGFKDKCPLCFVIHGFTGYSDELHIEAMAKAVTDCGIAALRVDMYGHGKSGGEFRKHNLMKWMNNVHAVMAYIDTLDFVTDLYVMGHSQGGLMAILTAAMYPDKVKALIPVSAATMIPDGAREGDLLGMNFDPTHVPDVIENEVGIVIDGTYVRAAQMVDVNAAIDRYPGKVLLIHGDADQTVPYSCSEKAAARYKDAKLVPIHGDDHCFELHVDQVQDAIRDFFKKL